MTLRELMNLAGAYPEIGAGIFIAIPLAAFLLGILHRRENGGFAPWKYFYAALVYLACFPGIFAALLIGYMLFFTRESLLDMNLLVSVLPIFSMIVTLLIIRRNVPFADVPGFDRISGLLLLIAITFFLVLIVEKTRIWLHFGSSFLTFLLMVAGLFLLLKWGLKLALHGRKIR